MRLLKQEADGTFGLTSDLTDDIPKYAILSHTWGSDDQEVSFADIVEGRGRRKHGYRKIEFCGNQAARDEIGHFWVDTCCINKSSSTELQEAINSMFRWYQQAAKCYVYLPDVSSKVTSDQPEWATAFRKTRWLTRGWTLQELIAPSSVEFFSREGERLGDKQSLGDLLQDVTRIPIRALRGEPLSVFSVAERMSWSGTRSTKKAEDMAYSLLGIFDVHMPMIYGEGKRNALRRLKEEIVKRSEEEELQSVGALDHVRSMSPINRGGIDYDMLTPTQKPHYTVLPFQRNLDFVGQESIITKLMDMIIPSEQTENCQRTLIEGLGGVGKTQIALEVSYRVRRKHPDCSIFWVPALSMLTFEKGYREIGKALGVSGLDDDKTDVKALIKKALDNENLGKWLMVVDNVDDMDLLYDKGADSSIRSALPTSSNGSILFTTRNPDATELLQKNLKKDQMDEESVDELVVLLANLPLAIKQAAAYMMRTGMTTRKYLGHFLASDKTQTRLLSHNFEDPHRYPGVANAIVTAWNISFTHISQEWPLAADSLKLICHFSEKEIPAALFPGEDELDRDEAVSVLKGYGFITERETTEAFGEAFDIHRLVRLAMQNWIKEKGEKIDWATKSFRQLDYCFPLPTHQNKDVWIKLMSHAQAALAMGEACSDKIVQATIIFLMAKCHYSLGKHAETERLYRSILPLQDGVLTQEHQLIYKSLSGLANVLLVLGKDTEAEHMVQQALEIKTKVLGPNHADTLSSLGLLADMSYRRKDFAKAEKEYGELQEKMDQILGPEHVNSLSNMNNFAMVLDEQGKYAEAAKMLWKALSLKETTLGREHPETINSMYNLSNVLLRQSKDEEAEDMIRRTVELREKVLGIEHPDTLMSKNSMGNMLVYHGKYDEAIMMLQQTVELEEKTLGPLHTLTLAGKQLLHEGLKRRGV
ncbi:hypothetical protein PG989_006349 [Apiospora arundinis]